MDCFPDGMTQDIVCLSENLIGSVMRTLQVILQPQVLQDET